MELRITNPQENWLTEQILWNNEELKAAIAEKVKDYKTICLPAERCSKEAD